MAPLHIHFGDNLPLLEAMPSSCANLVYIDPPFNTGRIQKRSRFRAVRDDQGDRNGFRGQRYRTAPVDSSSYTDVFDDYLAFLEPRLVEARRILTPNGSLFFHIDYREAHYCKVMLDRIFGRESFINEIVWAYDYGARSRRKWPAKHDTIFWYARTPADYVFNFGEMDRIPYMAPGLAGREKAARGKTPTDVWWHTIVSPSGPEKTGYPTQKPRGIIDRILRVHTCPGDTVCDFFAGSGTLGESAIEFGRDCILVDNNPEALRVMEKRFQNVQVHWHNWVPGQGE
jgi:site-specific DNA-methyltransferase (adenine-specific)